MPVSYRVLHHSRCIIVQITGVVGDQELLDAQAAMFLDGDFDGGYSRLIDLTACGDIACTGLTIRYVARESEQRGMKRAAIAANADHLYGLARMYQGYASGAVCECFHEFSPAADWLGLTAADLV